MSKRKSKLPSTSSLDKVMAALGKIVVIISLIAILLYTLFPFNFSSEINTGFDLRISKSDLFSEDWFRNIFLFFPFGFGLASLINQKNNRNETSVVLILIISFGLSFIVEAIQLYLPERTTSVGDMLANTCGGFCGFISWQISEAKSRRTISELVAKSQDCLTISKLTICFISYATLTFLLSVLLQSTTNLSNWDSTFWLVLGNEYEGNRPWRGKISEVRIADRALSKSEVAAVFANTPLKIINDSLVASYHFLPGESYHDRTKNLPELTWYPEEAEYQSNKSNGVILTTSRWLETASPATFLTQRLRKTSQFSLIVTVATADITQSSQTGPAAIVSISGDSHNNFTLGQVDGYLRILLQTPLTGEDGVKPILDVPEIFEDTNPHQLVITYDGSNIKIYKDTLNPSYSLELTPGSALFWKYFFFPHLKSMHSWIIYPTILSNKLYKTLYYGLIFIPLGLILGLVIKSSRLGVNYKIWLAFAGLLTTCAILEVILSTVSGKFMSLENLLLTIIIMVSGMLLTEIKVRLKRS